MSVSPDPAGALASLASLSDALGDCPDLDRVLTTALDALADRFGFEHSMLLLLDETRSTLFTIASHGYERPGIGSEVRLGEGLIGSVAADRTTRRIGNLQRMLSYARSARGESGDGDHRRIPLPGLVDANSQLAAPLTVSGQLLGVLAVESARLGAYTVEHEQLLAILAHLVAAAIELDRLAGGGEAVGRQPVPRSSAAGGPIATSAEPSTVRFYPVDGSTFVDGDYLIKGVPGRILFRLLSEHLAAGRTEFTNREIRLDPTLELPSFRDNLESRLILLKRRLDERHSPMRIDKTGRGQFRLVMRGPIELECREDAPSGAARAPMTDTGQERP